IAGDEPAVRRAPGREGEASAVLPAAGRRAEETLPGMDRLHPFGRSAAREAHPAAGHEAHRALQRRARMPALRIPHGGGRQPQAVSVETLLRLALVPAAIWLATLAARRWGHAVSGYLGGLPLIGGPITFYLALDHGAAFAARSATVTLAAIVGQGAYLLAFAHVARRAPWYVALP